MTYVSFSGKRIHRDGVVRLLDPLGWGAALQPYLLEAREKLLRNQEVGV